MTYNLSIARHRFYSWAACRAAQAGSAKAKRNEFLVALDKSGVVEYINHPPHPSQSQEDFDATYFQWVDNVVVFIKDNYNKAIPFGVAAKLISIYLKGAYVLHSKVDDPLAQKIHPPIDSILLKAIDKFHRTQFDNTYKWQKLDKNDYKYLIEELRKINGSEAFWVIEKHWQP